MYISKTAFNYSEIHFELKYKILQQYAGNANPHLVALMRKAGVRYAVTAFVRLGYLGLGLLHTFGRLMHDTFRLWGVLRLLGWLHIFYTVCWGMASVINILWRCFISCHHDATAAAAVAVAAADDGEGQQSSSLSIMQNIRATGYLHPSQHCAGAASQAA